MRRGEWARAVFVLAVGLAACGSGDKPADGSSTGPAGESAASTSAAPIAAPIGLPASVEDLTTLVPRDATVVLGLPPIDAYKSQLGAMYGLMREGLSVELASRLGLSSDTVSKLLDAYDGAAGFIVGDMKQPKLAAIVRVKDATVVRSALAEAKLEDKGNGRWSRGGPTPLAALLLEQARVVVVASDDATLSAALDAGNGGSFKTSPLFRARAADALWVAADTATVSTGMFKDAMDAGSKLTAAFGAGKLEVEYTQLGGRVPRLGLVLKPGTHQALGGLPGDALVAVGLSLARAPGKSLGDLMNELGRAGNPKLASDADAILQAGAKISLADLDRALGDELVVGVYGSGERIGGVSQDLGKGDDLGKQLALVAFVTTRDDKVAAGLVDSVANALSLQPGFKAGPRGSFSMENAGVSLLVNASAGRVRIVFGGSKVVTRVKGTVSPTLAEQATFKQATASDTKESQILLFADIASVAKTLPAEMTGQLAALGDVGATLTVTLKPNDAGIDLSAESAGGAAAVSAISAVASIGIYGVRRYLMSAKTSEAKNTVGAIARGAIAAFEREQASAPAHALCKSAPAVPATVPAGRRFTAKAGSDYDTGSDTEGWKCLKFMMTAPQYYQYAYRAGGDYKGPKRGGPNPGADGFEISAEGDLDADGLTSLFTLTGKLDKATNTVKLDTGLFIADEFE